MKEHIATNKNKTLFSQKGQKLKWVFSTPKKPNQKKPQETTKQNKKAQTNKQTVKEETESKE